MEKTCQSCDVQLGSSARYRTVCPEGSSVPVEPRGPCIADSVDGHTEQEAGQATAHSNLQDTAIAESAAVLDETFSPHDQGLVPSQQPPDRYE